MHDAQSTGRRTGPVQFLYHPDGVLEMQLSRPEKRNALSAGMLRQVIAATHYFDQSRAVVLTARGHVFSAGVDMSELHGDERDLKIDRLVHVTAEALAEQPVPVFAAVNGPCIGAALELLLACDGWVFGPDASLHLPSMKMGLVYHPGTLARLQQRIGSGAVQRLVLMQEALSALDVVEAVKVTGHADAARERALEIAAAVAARPAPLVTATKRHLAGLANGDEPSTHMATHEASFSTPERQAAVASVHARRAVADVH
jgi:enoyl-CoA hydratase